MGLGVLDHLLDFALGQAARRLDADLLLLAGRLVLGVDVDDAVGVDVERDLDLRHAARGGRDPHQVELAEHLVVGRHLALALEHPDGHRVLIVFRGGEHLALLGGDRGVAIDDAGEHPAQRLDAERERRHVEQQHVLDVALQHAGLDRGADRHHLVRIDALVRLLAEQLLHHFLHFGHAGHAADQHHLVDLGGRKARVLERLLDRLLHQIVDQRLELGARQLHGQVLRPARVGGDEGQVDLGLGGRGQLDLGLLGRLLEALERELVAAQVDALLLLELVGQVADQAHVEVFAAQEGVAIGRLHFEYAVADLEDRDVEGAAAEVVDRDGAALLLVESVGERGRGRLVDDAQHLEAGDLAGVLGGLALGVVEIGRHRDDGLVDRRPEMGLGRLLHFLQDEGGNLRRRIGLAVGLDPGVAIGGAHQLIGDELLVLLDHRVVVAPADQALDREEGLFRIGDRLALGGLPHQPLAVIGKRDDRRRRARALCVLDDFRRLAFHHGDAGICRAEVDANDLAHSLPSRCSRSDGPLRHPKGRPAGS